MSEHNMDHLDYLPHVAKADVNMLHEKERTYMGSWKRAGGRSAWFMFRRNMDRLIEMLKKPADIQGWQEPETWRRFIKGYANSEEIKHLAACYCSENIFAMVRDAPGGEDGTVLACLRDLRRYAMLIEAEMMARGVVEVPPQGSTLARGDEIENDFYHLKAQEWAVNPDSAKVIIESALQDYRKTHIHTADPPPNFPATKSAPYRDAQWYCFDCGKNLDGISVHSHEGKFYCKEHYLKIVGTDQPTPEAGSHHATLTPWAVALGWRTKHGLKLDDNVFDQYWKLWTPGKWVLRDAVKNNLDIPSIISGLYQYSKVTDYWIIKIADVPPELRGCYPTLQLEANHKERSELPEWQQTLYEWLEAEGKYRLMAMHKEWAVGQA